MTQINPCNLWLALLPLRAFGGDDEDDGVAGWADVEGAYDHRFAFVHADVRRNTRALVIDRRSNRAVRRDRATHLDWNARAKVERVHLHYLLPVATTREFHLPYPELTETRHRHRRRTVIQCQRRTDPTQIKMSFVLHAIVERLSQPVVLERQCRAQLFQNRIECCRQFRIDNVLIRADHKIKPRIEGCFIVFRFGLRRLRLHVQAAAEEKKAEQEQAEKVLLCHCGCLLRSRNWATDDTRTSG